MADDKNQDALAKQIADAKSQLDSLDGKRRQHLKNQAERDGELGVKMEKNVVHAVAATAIVGGAGSVLAVENSVIAEGGIAAMGAIPAAMVVVGAAAAADVAGLAYEGYVTRDTGMSYAKEDKRFQAGTIAPEFRPRDAVDPEKPLMTDYKYLAAVKGMIAKHLPEGKIDGKDVVNDFSEIDFTKPDNYRAYKGAITQEITDQKQIKQANHTMSRKIGWGGDKAARRDGAGSQLHLFAAAEKEFGQYEERVLKYNGDKAKQAAEGVGIASHGVSDPASGKKDTVIQAPVVAATSKPIKDQTSQR
jgi:hypothetical protein